MLSLFPSLQPGVSLLQLNSLNARHREAEAQGRDVEGTAEPHRRDVSKAQSHKAPLPGGRMKANPSSSSLLSLLPSPGSRRFCFPSPQQPPLLLPLLPPLAHTGRGHCPVRYGSPSSAPKQPIIPCLFYGSPLNSHKADGTSLRLLKNCSSASSSASRLGALTSNLLVQHQVNKCNKCHLEA